MTLSDLGSLASLVGLGLSAYVIYIALTVKRFHNRHFRIPKLMDSIHEYRKQLGIKLKQTDVPEAELFDGSLGCQANLKSLATKLPKKIRGNTEGSVQLIETFMRDKQKSTLVSLHERLELVEGEIWNWMEDEMIGGM